MTSNSRWQLRIANNRLIPPKLKFSDSDVPVLDVVSETGLVTQIGLNVPHKKDENFLFSELEEDNENKPYLWQNTKEYQELVLTTTLKIMFKDHSFSNFIFSKLNNYKIHVSDPEFIDFLKLQEKLHEQERCYLMLEAADFNLTHEMYEQIAKNPEKYKLFLSYCITGKDARERFHKAMLKAAKEAAEKNKHYSSGRQYLKDIRRATAELRRAFNTSPLETSIKTMTKQLKPSPIITCEQLEEIYEEFEQKGFCPSQRTKSEVFSDVRRLKTTLHEAANTGYSPDIRTFVVTEPFHSIDLTQYGTRKSLHHRKRKKLLEGVIE